MKKEKFSFYLIIVSALFITTYITSNIMSVKILNIAGISIFDAGTIIFPISYMLGDVLTEVWGFKTAKKIIWLTFFCCLFLILFTALGLILPSPEYMKETNDAYAVVFGYVPRIVVASLIGFLGGELSNSYIMEKIKHKMGEKHLWIRTIVSSVVGYVFDTVLFVIIAFAGTVSGKDLISMILIQYFVKLGIEALGGTPLAYAAINYIKKKESI